MGRKASGFRIFRRPDERAWRVQFSHAGRQHKLSTGLSDEDAGGQPTEAVKIRASEIYAQTVAGRYAKPERRRTGTALGAEPLGATAARWLTEISATIDVETATTYALYAGTHWEPHFATATGVTTESALAYARGRLKHVKASTVRKELSALRGFVGWLRGDAAPRIPGVPKRVQGTPDKRAARSFTELSPAETWALIAALRERSAPRFGGWPIRARFVVAYETGLRPATLDALEAPTHYTRGAAELTLTPDIDKARAGRPLPLTDRAREALDSVCPEAGLIFGAHDYRPALAEAAEKALPPNRRPTPYDLRRMFCTHLAEVSDNLPGMQFLMGHASASTTAIYIKASKRAALDVLRSTGRLTRPADRQAEGVLGDSDGLAGVLEGGERLPDDER
jgi:integrase/recombinase XerC